MTKQTIDFHAPYLTDGDLSGTTSDTNGALSEPSSDTNGDVPETSLDTDGDISQIPSQADAELSGSVKQVDVLSFEMQDGEALTTLSDDDIAYQKTIGDGAVILVGCSFSMAPLTEYENRAAFAACVLEASAVDGTERIVSYGGSGYNPYAAYDTSVTEMLDVADKPKLLHYGILFGIYILLVGPILYFILDKLKKKAIYMDWNSGAVPAIYRNGISGWQSDDDAAAGRQLVLDYPGIWRYGIREYSDRNCLPKSKRIFVPYSRRLLWGKRFRGQLSGLFLLL